MRFANVEHRAQTEIKVKPNAANSDHQQLYNLTQPVKNNRIVPKLNKAVTMQNSELSKTKTFGQGKLELFIDQVV